MKDKFKLKVQESLNFGYAETRSGGHIQRHFMFRCFTLHTILLDGRTFSAQLRDILIFTIFRSVAIREGDVTLPSSVFASEIFIRLTKIFHLKFEFHIIIVLRLYNLNR